MTKEIELWGGFLELEVRTTAPDVILRRFPVWFVGKAAELRDMSTEKVDKWVSCGEIHNWKADVKKIRGSFSNITDSTLYQACINMGDTSVLFAGYGQAVHKKTGEMKTAAYSLIGIDKDEAEFLVITDLKQQMPEEEWGNYFCDLIPIEPDMLLEAARDTF